MKERMRFLDRNTMARVCRRCRFRIKAVINADDKFIEYIHSRYIPLPSFFTSIKSDNFQLCCEKKNISKVRIYRCHPVIASDYKELLAQKYRRGLTTLWILV